MDEVKENIPECFLSPEEIAVFADEILYVSPTDGRFIIRKGDTVITYIPDTDRYVKFASVRVDEM